MTDNDQPRIGLALSSGGARGFAHIGVIKALQEAGLQVASVAGSSMGSIMAAGYAVRADIAELERWALEFRARDHSRLGFGLPIMDAERITGFLDDLFNGARFTDCAVPLAVVATDLRSREATTIRSGPVALATYASMAMPFLHRPVQWNGYLLAEGSLSCILPTAQADQPGIDLVIGSMVSREWSRLDGVMTGFAHTVGRVTRGWHRQYAEFMRGHSPQVAADPPLARTILIAPQLDKIGSLDFSKVREAIAAGERAVAARLDEIKALLESR